MASPRAVSGDRKSDDLEIVSVGALYSGSWDKKYWSSSRGKDRFPYPVGYKAVRTQNENTYYMEIEEGAKGPLFLIRYLDESWTGQTPDIAWGKFQKTTGFSNLKVWHGKRFTCKMTGVEFFGFKNPLVQRLLRELVTNSHGMVDSNSSNRVSQIRVNDERPIMPENPDLLRYLDMPVARKKRSRKAEIVHQSSVVKDNHKKPRFQDSISGAEILNVAPVSICPAKGVEIVCLQGELQEQLHSCHATNENLSLPLENPPEMKVAVAIQETNQLSDTYKTKLLSSIAQQPHGLQEKENKPNDDTFLNESQDMAGSNLCAPDTLEFVQDNPITSVPVTDDNTSCEQREELTLADMVVNEGHSTEPDTEDLADQETAKSMISFLLPRAIPLLKKKSVKKTSQNDMSETMSARLNRSDNSKTSQLDDASGADVSLSTRICSGDDENRRVVALDSVQDFTGDVPTAPDSFDESHLDVPGSEHIISSSKEAYPADLPKNPIDEEDVVIVNAGPLVSALDTVEIIKPSSHDVHTAPDSFDESHLDVLGSGHIISPSKEAYAADLPDKPIGEEQVVTENASLSVPGLDTVEILKPSAHDVSTTLAENNLDGCVKKSMLIPQCTSPTNRIITKKSEELCAKGDLVQTEPHSENKEAKSTSFSTEGNGLVVGTTPTEVSSVRKETHKVYSRKRVSTNQLRGNKKNSSSESKNSFRKTGDGDSISKMSPIKTQRILEPQPTLSTNSVSDRTNPQGDGSSHVTEHYQGLELMKANNNQVTSVFCNESCVIPQDIRPAQGFGNASTSVPSFSAPKVENVQGHIGEALRIQVSEPLVTKSLHKEHTSEKNIFSVPEISTGSSLKLNRDIKTNNEMEKTVDLLGCYFHPMPVSLVLLQSVGNEIYISVLSVATEDRVRTLFMYKISAEGPTKGFPSVVGHTPVILPIVEDKSDGNVISRTLERSYFHVTPDGEHLVLTGNIKTAYCRKREIECSCLTCTSASFEENAVRIVEVKTGYVSLVTKLQAVDSVQCVVVCDLKYLVAVVKGGNLIVWAMNSNWRGPTEEFTILANPCISSCIVELKKIPKCSHLIIGHNGIGEFTVWDISTRSQVSSFVSPSNGIFEFIPISLFAWHPLRSHSTMEDHVDMILAATKLWFSKGINNKTLVPAEVKDTAIWILVSTDADPEVKCDSVERPARCWRLALLVRNQVILGSPLDPRADVAGTVSGNGVTGTLDGLVYFWDLSTGLKLGSLHDFKGQGVSCISSDDFGNICVASEDGQLLVYCHPTKETQNQGL